MSVKSSRTPSNRTPVSNFFSIQPLSYKKSSMKPETLTLAPTTRCNPTFPKPECPKNIEDITPLFWIVRTQELRWHAAIHALRSAVLRNRADGQCNILGSPILHTTLFGSCFACNQTALPRPCKSVTSSHHLGVPFGLRCAKRMNPLNLNRLRPAEGRDRAHRARAHLRLS